MMRTAAAPASMPVPVPSFGRAFTSASASGRVLACVLALFAVQSQAQPQAQAQTRGYPDHPVRLVIPFPPGGPSDALSRALAEPFRARFGQPLVIENRPGAAGNLGTEIVAKSPADGYSLVVITDTVVTVNPHVYRKLAFDAAKDLVPVALLSGFSQTLVCNGTVPAKSLAELMALAKKQPLNYASGGPGSPGHLAMELLASVAGVQMTHVPYKGPAPAMQDVIGGQVPCGFLATPTILPHVASGRLNAFAISSARRSALAPQVPTVAEAGYRDYDATFYLALMAPRGTPPEVLQSLNAFVNDMLKNPELQAKVLAPGDQVAVGGSAADAQATLRAVSAKWEKVVARIGLSLD